MRSFSKLSAVAVCAVLSLPVAAWSQSAGGSAGGAGGTSAGGANGAPAAGAAGAGSAATSGIPPGPANPGGLNNTLNDPSGQGNAARVGTQTPGTNAAGTANSSGPTTSGSSVNAGSNASVTSGSNARATGGVSVTGPNRTGDVNLDAEDRAVDKKIKSICKGC